MANGPMRGFTPFGSGGPSFDPLGGTGGQIQGPQLPTGTSIPGLGLAKFGASAVSFGVEFAGILSAIKQVKAQSRMNRLIAEKNAENEISNLRLFEKRFVSKQRAQSGATGFAVESSLVNRLQTMRDTDIKVIRRNEALANQLNIIDANERAAKRGLKAKLAGSAASFALGSFGGLG